ncbi:MAG: hypothetical protein KC964_13430 [Candidatus Omnitrophica bacterium]|nr:hypothetical protein [Candidatus Omnitrophota bacterium]
MACQRMTRCHCHNVEFSTVAQYAQNTGIQEPDVLCERVGLGQTCTACRCDLADFLKEQRQVSVSAPSRGIPALKPSKAIA